MLGMMRPRNIRMTLTILIERNCTTGDSSSAYQINVSLVVIQGTVIQLEEDWNLANTIVEDL